MKRTIDWSLYLVTDQKLCGNRSLVEVVLEAVRGGVSIVQLREKTCSTREFIEVARRIKKSLPPQVLLLINDRVDVALAGGADGVHIGQSDMEYADARRWLGPDAIIGLSVESDSDVVAAQALDVDYLGVSPIFETPTKLDTSTPWGLEGLRRLRGQTDHVLIGIGGIRVENVGDVITNGADGVAVVSAICASPNPVLAASELRRTIEAARAGRMKGAR